MGLVLDSKSIALYEKWLQCPQGRAIDEFFQEMIPVLLKPHKNDKILDIGCGTGNQLLSLSKLGLDLSGVDASPDMIEIAKSRLGNRCELKSGHAEDLPFNDNEFDIALLVNTLEFLDDPLKALKEAGRVARRKVLICFLNRLSFCNLGARLHGVFRKTMIRHIKLYDLWEMKSHIKNAYGAVPVAWRCRPDWPQLMDRCIDVKPDKESSFNCPVGTLLCVSATLNPLIRGDSLPLRIKAKQTFSEGVPIQNQGGSFNERGISI